MQRNPNKLDARAIPEVYLDVHERINWTFIPHSRDISIKKHALLDETVFSLAKAIQTEHVPMEKDSEPEYDFSARNGSQDVAFPESDRQKIFVNNVQTSSAYP